MIYVAVALGVFGTLTVDEVISSGAGLYPATGLCEEMAPICQFPPRLGERIGGRAPAGLVVTAAVAIILAVGFDLTSIASIGSAVALIVFALVTAGHLHVRAETGARTSVLVLAIAATVIVLLAFAFTTLVEEPGTAVALVVILLLSTVLDVRWKRSRDTRLASA